MKILLIIPALAIALLTGCYHIDTPLDPMTMKPSTRCLPAGSTVDYDSGK